MPDPINLTSSVVLEGKTLERMAAANHEIYCAAMKEKGYIYDTVRDDARKTSPLLVPYLELPEAYKESNRNAVRSIAEKIKSIGFIMIQARSNEPPFDFPGVDLEKLAEMEHDRYMREAISQGWSFGPQMDPVLKTNPTLLPWKVMTDEELHRRYPDIGDKLGRTELPDFEKQKDRAQVQGYPEILKRAGYTIVKLRGSSL